MEALVVVVEAATPSWTSNWNVLSIQGTQGMCSTSDGKRTRPPTSLQGLWGMSSRHLDRP